MNGRRVKGFDLGGPALRFSRAGLLFFFLRATFFFFSFVPAGGLKKEKFQNQVF